MEQLDSEEARHWRRVHNLALLTQRFVKCLLLGQTPFPQYEPRPKSDERTTASTEVQSKDVGWIIVFIPTI